MKPGATPTFFGLFAWSAARLFVEQATKLGGKLSRSSLVTSLKGVNNWTANGMHAPQPVGAKQADVLALHPPRRRQVVAGRRHEVPVQRRHVGRVRRVSRPIRAPRCAGVTCDDVRR